MAAKKGIGLHEARTRVIGHLPLNNKEEEKAVNRIIAYLERERSEPLGVKGFTRTSLRLPVLRGHWWSSGRRKWVRENIVLFIIDYKVDFDAEEASDKVAELKREIRRWYEHYTGRPQEEVWLVAQPVFRED